jgi:proline iminopeptidase
LYVHGGPGNNSALFEAFVNSSSCYADFEYGWIFYDQRGCGQSEIFLDDQLSHPHNISDLNEMIMFSRKCLTTNLVGIIGHSYGARLVHDVMIKYKPDVLPVMLGVASSFKTARKKSLAMDLLNLKLNQPKDYAQVLDSLDQYGSEVWRNAKALRSKMSYMDQRKLFYWGNLKAFEQVNELKKNLKIKETNENTFNVVREELHHDPRNYLGPNPEKFNSRYLWINGLHDFLMAGELLDYENKGIKTFFKSGHFPHMEEPGNFLSALRVFLEGGVPLINFILDFYRLIRQELAF